jgi:hypothetical protein
LKICNDDLTKSRCELQNNTCLFRSTKKMAQSKEQAIKRAKADLSRRLKITESEIKEESIENTDFPDTSLGAPEDGEMSGQMISSGWKIRLNAKGKTYEYRADADQLRLFQFNGANYLLRL